MDILEGRGAVVTGAASGIGLAVVEAFVAEGMRVVMADIDEEALEQHGARLRADGFEVHPVTLDVTDPEAVDRAARFTSIGSGRSTSP